MACCFCNSSPGIWGLAYPLCKGCYEGAKSIFKMINQFETDQGNAKASYSSHSPTSSCKSLSDASKWVAGMTENLSFLHELIDSHRHRTPSDILLKPRCNGPPIAAHRALLAGRSKIFKNMLESDACKATKLNTITLPELNHDELEALVEFLHGGKLPSEVLERHVYALAIAADKYQIDYLLKYCQNHMIETLSSSNALVVLKVSDLCSFLALRDTALRFIVQHLDDIVVSAGYETFVAENPRLIVQITRALSTKNTEYALSTKNWSMFILALSNN